MSASILFADVPGFYAEIERARHPDLSDRPILVGGDPGKRGVVQAASLDAEAMGVTVGMPVELALARCLHARALRTDMPHYREMDKRFRACLGRSGERVEPVGLGAAFLDVRELPESPDAIARSLRERVRRELGLPLRTGAAAVKFVARLAAEEAGPDGFRSVEPAEVERFLGPLAVSRLPGVGPNTVAKLAEIEARTIAELAALPRTVVETQLGNRGLELLAAALGRGDDRVRAARHPQTLSFEATLAAGEIDRSALGDRLRVLAERLERALALEGLVAHRLVLKLRYEDGEAASRTLSLDRGIATAAEVVERATDLLARTHAGSRPVRLVGLAATRLERPRRDERQLRLFE